ncbi:unnamed protein product [Onchocerca ochengi]|uniref:Amino acid transporter transmembrane domain-containing protein n=1 Tax=Onchocerca ochengi TaxID=42157 RepID=A0A182EHP7_ONCOC|nr:unnamed protein product [Onchocerca ochengi]
MNILLQGLYSWEFIKNLPPGSGGIPKIVSFYGINLSLTGLAFMLHVIIAYLIYILPENLELPFQLLTGDYLDEEYQEQNHQKQQQYNNPIAIDQNPTFSSIITNGSGLELRPTTNDCENIALTDNTNSTIANYSQSRSQSGNEITIDANPRIVKCNDIVENEHIAQQLYVIRRLIFFMFLIIYIISIPICLF